MRTLDGELGKRVRRWRRDRRAERALRRGLLLLVPLFVLVAHLGLQGVVSRPVVALAFPLLFVATVWLTFVVYPDRPEPEAVDREFGARDSLATLLLEPEPFAARRLLTSFALDRVRESGVRIKRRRRKLVRRLMMLAVLLLLAIFFLPGHSPLPGPGSARAGGATPDSIARGGAGGARQSSETRRPDDGSDSESKTSPQSTSERDRSEREPQDTKTGARPDDPERDWRVADDIVFPDFRGEGPRSKRAAPRIDRTPGSVPAGQDTTQKSQARTKPKEGDERPDWKKQKERALARGKLAPWEGQLLELWGKALDDAAANRARSAGVKERDEKENDGK